MNSYDVESKTDESEIRDGNGEVKAWYGYNPTREATFTYYVAAATMNASASVVKPTIGTLMTVTDSNAGGGATGSYWVVKSSTENASNTDAVKVSVKATEYSGNITA
jgi:hypothetical protein